MIGDVEFNSACYYKYFSIDVDALTENLAGPLPESPTATESQKMKAYDQTHAEAQARWLLKGPWRRFSRAAIFTTPSGKQNTFAAHQLPDAVLVETRPTAENSN